MAASPPPGSEGQIERLLQALGRVGERIQSVVAAAFPQANDGSLLSGTDEQLTESAGLGNEQRAGTELNQAVVGETDATPSTEFPLDAVDQLGVSSTDGTVPENSQEPSSSLAPEEGGVSASANPEVPGNNPAIRELAS
ncbi:MAG: hypothetical protein ACO3GW_03720, partial [Vulcanococcus sp.]